LRLVTAPLPTPLLIAATALAVNLPLYSANPADFAGLEMLIDLEAIKINPRA
jgi:predicted nucleic acid-binding protein